MQLLVGWPRPASTSPSAAKPLTSPLALFLQDFQICPPTTWSFLIIDDQATAQTFYHWGCVHAHEIRAQLLYR